MIKYFVFKILLEDTGKIVRLETVPIISQHYEYDRTNQYYKQYVTYDYDLINNDRNDLYSIARISEIKVGESRKCIFADGSYMLFKRKSATNYNYFFYAPNGSLYNEISGVEQDFTYTGIERKYLALGGPTSTIEYTTPDYPKCGSYSADMPDGGIGSYEKTNTALTGEYTYSTYITRTKGTGYPITYGHALIGNLINNAQYKDPKFISDTSTTGGGDGDYDDNSSDTIGLPDLTALNQNSISNTKFLTCYKMTPAQLSKLGDELWSDNIFTQISNTVLKPTDFIVNLSLLPVDVGGVTKLIKAGKILLNGAEGTLISQQFIRVDCGTLEVKKKWGGAIDYQTDVSIFLPFIGEQSLNANEVIGATLNVIYTVDILSGSCIASVRVIKDNLDAVLYQFSGNMASNFPITSADYATVFSGALQLAVGVGSLPSSGGVLSLVSATSNMLSGANVKRTGSLSSASGFMGIKKPYLILSRPIQSLPENYNSFHGYVSNITMKLKDCKGYTQVDSIHIDNVPCMEEEKTRLLQILKEGIII